MFFIWRKLSWKNERFTNLYDCDLLALTFRLKLDCYPYVVCRHRGREASRQDKPSFENKTLNFINRGVAQQELAQPLMPRNQGLRLRLGSTWLPTALPYYSTWQRAPLVTAWQCASCKKLPRYPTTPARSTSSTANPIILPPCWEVSLLSTTILPRTPTLPQTCLSFQDRPTSSLIRLGWAERCERVSSRPNRYPNRGYAGTAKTTWPREKCS